MTDLRGLENETSDLYNRCRLFIEQAQIGILTDPTDITVCLPSQYKAWEVIVIGILLTILTIATAGGNILIGLAILLVRRLRNPANLLLLNLALSDFLISLLVLPFAIIYQLTGYWPFSQNVCDVYIVCDVLLCTASILSLCAISVDRYLAITRPLTYASKRTTRRMIFMIGTCWLLAGLISVPPVFIFEKPKLLFHCGYSEDLTYQIYATFSAFYIPLLIMLILYGRIYFVVRKLAITNARAASQFCDTLNLRDIPTERSNRTTTAAKTTTTTTTAAVAETTTPPPPTTTTFADPGVHLQTTRLTEPLPIHSYNSHQNAPSKSRVESLFVDGTINHMHSKTDETRPTSSVDYGSTIRLPPTRSLSPISLSNLHLHSYTFARMLSRGSARASTCSESVARKRVFFNNSENAKAVITLGVIMGSFTLCWLPFFVCQLLNPILNAFHVSLNQLISLQMFQFFLWLGYMNSLLNPIIYAKFNRDFRLPFYCIIKCQCKGINQRVRRSSYVTQFEGQRYSHPTSIDTQRPLIVRNNRRNQQRFSANSELPTNRGSEAQIQNNSQT
ncbi:5-hydroxytryptamine receptor 1A-alpha [Fasciola gigantica]|uniref:5-hydroxytryptamine receptor 1A-alpha n=1 Tax=Fasciola gigantica TaxID=46835 RepID=A0A504YYN4_FASGI|nr:5-hydroxytryptamine receptor 1A-alpha [Fasciola gigantica]